MDIKRTVKARIISNARIAPDHYMMDLEERFLPGHSAAGQFVNIKVRDIGTDPLLRIPLGISRITKKGISVVYKVVGEGTKILKTREPGEYVDILGPLGKSFDTGGSGKKRRAILVAGGHGIAPLYALAEELISQGSDVEVLAGAATKGHLVLIKELKRAGCTVKTATEDGSGGKKGYVTGLLSDRLAEKQDAKDLPEVYACGPRPMLAAVAREVAARGLTAQVSLDAYMACGIGVCLGCAVRTKTGYKMVCKDGPVFLSDEIEWEEAGVTR
jgi:dihydroorotate dehydrogenase electron transfer subunit